MRLSQVTTTWHQNSFRRKSIIFPVESCKSESMRFLHPNISGDTKTPTRLTVLQPLALVLAQQQRMCCSIFYFAFGTPPLHCLWGCMKAGLYKEVGHSKTCFLSSVNQGWRWNPRPKHTFSHLCLQLTAFRERVSPSNGQWILTVAVLSGKKKDTATWICGLMSTWCSLLNGVLQFNAGGCPVPAVAV